MLMEKVKKSSKKLAKFIISLPKRDFSILFPSFYLLVMVIGFLFTALFYAYPSFVTCSNFLGQEFCTPTGVYLGFMASIPGYFIVGSLLGNFINRFPIAISFFLVVGTSVLVYFLLGLLMQKLKKGKFLGKRGIEKLVVISFIIILVLLILLVL